MPCAVQTIKFLRTSIYCFNHFANSDWIQLRSTIIEFNNINLYLCTLHFITRCYNNIPLKRSNTKPTNTRNNNYRPCLSFFIGDTLWRRMSVRKIKKSYRMLKAALKLKVTLLSSVRSLISIHFWRIRSGGKHALWHFVIFLNALQNNGQIGIFHYLQDILISFQLCETPCKWIWYCECIYVLFL